MDVQPKPLSAVTDTRQFRDTLGAFATGVTVVTVGPAAPHGMTANSFAAVSLEPPLVSICVERRAIMHRSLLSAGTFGVSVLAAHQGSVARYFADQRRPLGMPQFDIVDCQPGACTGAPLITGALAHLECRVWRTYDGGDHTIFVGSVLSIERAAQDEPLLFLYGKLQSAETTRAEVST